MSWSFRKSTKLGPIRLNFSKSGVSMSAGVKGARIRFGPSGTFVTLGSDGIYYRHRLDASSPRSPQHLQDNKEDSIRDSSPTQTESRHTITSANLGTLTDVSSEEFIAELESKGKKLTLLPLLGIAPSLLLFGITLYIFAQTIRTEKEYASVFTISKAAVNIRDNPSTTARIVRKARKSEKFKVLHIDSAGWLKVLVSEDPIKDGFIHSDLGNTETIVTQTKEIRMLEQSPNLKSALLLGIVVISTAWSVYVGMLDKRRKTLSIYYDMDTNIEILHRKFLSLFSDFASARRIWQKLHGQNVSNRKYSAGASELVSRAVISGISINRPPSKYLKTNISIPFIGLKNTELYFFPERLVLKRGEKFGAVLYENLDIESSTILFIEEDTVPSDALVVNHTWKYLNKSGGPDMRFKANYRIPICNYSEYSLRSKSGINEVVTTSKPGAMDEFADFIRLIGEYQRSVRQPN